VNADGLNACRNTANHPAETDGGTSVDPSAAIAAVALWSTSVSRQAPPLREPPFFAPGASRFERFLWRFNARWRSVKKLRPSTSWTSHKGCDRDLPSMSVARPLGTPFGRVFANNSHLAASAGCQNGVGKTTGPIVCSNNSAEVRPHIRRRVTPAICLGHRFARPAGRCTWKSSEARC
jgi:hypothetical protein